MGEGPTTDGEVHRIPLRGVHAEIRGTTKRSLSISASDCQDAVPPTPVSEWHREIVNTIDRRCIRDGVTHGHITHDADGEVIDWAVDEALLAEA